MLQTNAGQRYFGAADPRHLVGWFSAERVLPPLPLLLLLESSFPAPQSLRCICLLLKYYLPEGKKKKLCFISMKAEKLQKKPKNSVWDLLQFSLLSYCNIKSIAPLCSYLGVFPWTTLTKPTFLLQKPSEVGVKRHYFQHFALKSINQHKQSRATHSSRWDLLHPTAATDTRHTKRFPQSPWRDQNVQKPVQSSL